MQVKKFEARTMKEALEMVKIQLGPDAIILAAKDNSKKYGLVGESSFEITAAVSEQTLHKKKYVESHMGEVDRNRFSQSSARTQKDIIDKFVSKKLNQNASRPSTGQRYIDIVDERNIAEERIRNAAQRAYSEFAAQTTPAPSPKFSATKVLPKKPPTPMTSKPNPTEGDMQILKNEIHSLKSLLTQYQGTPTSFPGSHVGLHYELSAHYQKLLREGVSEDLAIEFLLEIQEQVPVTKLKNRSLIEGLLAKKILESTLLSNADDKKFHFFVGPSGTGKTSMLIKLASQMIVMESKKVAVISADTHKVGAIEQLRIYTQILNVPFAVLRHRQDWREILKFIENIDVVLIDFPGSNLRSNEDLRFIENLIFKEVPSKVVHLVLSARSKLEDLNESYKRFTQVPFDDVIFNHLDESAQNGHLYSFVKQHQIPIHSFGIGPKIPEDFEYATKERLVDLIFHITQMEQNRNEATL